MYIDWIWPLDVQYVSVMMAFSAQLAEGGGPCLPPFTLSTYIFTESL
jgi:hypothetical protein